MSAAIRDYLSDSKPRMHSFGIVSWSLCLRFKRCTMVPNSSCRHLADFDDDTLAKHLAGELFKMMAGINLVHVPYRGSAPMMTDLVAGQVQVGFDVMVTSLPHVRTGALRALGVAGSNRFDMLPDVPTIAETVPGYEARTWAGVGVPKGTPPEIIARLNHEINAGLANPTIKSRLAELGTIPMIFSAADFGAFVATESEKWAKVIQFAGIKPE